MLLQSPISCVRSLLGVDLMTIFVEIALLLSHNGPEKVMGVYPQHERGSGLTSV